MTGAAPPKLEEVSALAERLRDAAATRVPIAPLTSSGTLDIDGAYAIQKANVRHQLGKGARVVGRKIGLTSTAMQNALGVDEPDYGVLFADMVLDDGATVHPGELIQPKAEAEIAVVVGADLCGPGVTTHQALAAIDAVVPSVEIIDSRIVDWRIALEDTVADNASAGRAVLGSGARRPQELDLGSLGMALWCNGQLVATGAGAAALGHPARCVAWLANKLAQFGEGLSAGDLVLPGALHVAVPVRTGDVLRADFAHLGSVRVRFAEEGDG